MNGNGNNLAEQAVDSKEVVNQAYDLQAIDNGRIFCGTMMED
jgi:hypothetical protein